jgi:hypothetical protein
VTRTKKVVIGLAVGILVCLLFIGGVLLGAAVVGFKAARRAGNEAAIVQHLKTISASEIQYYNTHNRQFGTFEELIRQKFLNERFRGDPPVVDGYVLTLTVNAAAGNDRSSYVVTAEPQDHETGTNHFYFDSSSTEIHVNPNRRAGPSDPPLNK